MKGSYLRLLVSLPVLYCVLSAVLYLSDPLALSPQLDARENLILASQISRGTLSPEPFYRAMLYPVILSLMHPVEARPVLGLLFGLVCHLVNGGLVYLLARKTWDKPMARLLPALLYLLNPASLFFSLQLLDVSFAISLFLGGLCLGLADKADARRVMGSGFLFGLSVLARPHFLPVVLLAPAILSLWPGKSLRTSALGWLPILGLLLVQGLLNLGHSGDFRLLPWQGSYNLYAANRPGANGLYFKQVLDMSGRGNDMNPARAESVALYGQNHPEETPPYSIDAMNAYWKSRLLDTLRADPLSLAKLVAFKAYAIVNSHEQYNNLSFPYHRARLPWLRWNPLNWGILVFLGMISLVVLFSKKPGNALVMLLLLLAYASTLLLYYASARFRLPLVPLLAILAGGVIYWPTILKRNPRYQAGIPVLGIGILLLTYSSFAGIRNDDTFVQDKLLMANAHADLGQDLEAARMARLILETHPERKEAQRIYAISYFNLRLLQNPAAKPLGNWQDQQSLIIQLPPTDPVQDSILGIYYWTWNRHDEARRLWESVSQTNPSNAHLANACLKLTGMNQPDPPGLSPLEQALYPFLTEAPSL